MRVILKVVAGVCVREDRQVPSIEHEPLSDLPELFGWNGQLNATARVRTDRTNMVVTFRNPETVACGMTQGPGLLDLFGIEVDMGMKVADRVLWASHCA